MINRENVVVTKFNPSLIQSISGVGKPLKEHLNWGDDLEVTDWLLC